MILSDGIIERMIKEGYLCTNIQDDNSIQPASLDITLGDSYSIPRMKLDGKITVVSFDRPVEYIESKSDSFLLYSKQFVLATTQEYIKLPNNVTAFVEGRSSIGRLGLFIQNAGWVDPGFEGQITLELFNASDNVIELKAGTRIGQLVFAKMEAPAEHPYCGKYQGQIGATGSMIYKDFLED